VSSLTRHISSVHEHSENYTCKTCGRSFTRVDTLKKHELTHSGLKPHACEVCEKTFSRRDGLNRHVKRHDKNVGFPCEKCSKRFMSRSDLERHEMAMHREEVQAGDDCDNQSS